MPIIVTFDFPDTIDNNDRNRIRVAFQRLGWEVVGGSAYRYPKMGAHEGGQEDWLNCVVPALMYFRSLVENKDISVKRFTIDASSSTGFTENLGIPIAKASNIQMQPPKSADTRLSEARLKRWIEACSDAIGDESAQ